MRTFVNLIASNRKVIRKFFVAVAAALGVLAVALVDGSVDASEWVQIALAALGALGVYAVPNRGDEPEAPDVA